MKRSVAAVLFLVVALTGYSQSDQWEFRSGPRFWGASLAARYLTQPSTVDGVETSITGYLSGAYEAVGYYRAPNGSLFTAASDGSDAGVTSYNRIDVRYELGVQQGIAPRRDVPSDLAVAFALYRGQFDYPFRTDEGLFFQSSRPETEGSWRGSVVSGLAFSYVEDLSVVRTRSGVAAELALEWGPPFLHNQVLGDADYSRLTLSGRGFLPLHAEEPVNGRNVFSAYLAGFGVIDWTHGPSIPEIVRSTTGGRSVRSAPGGSVRGFNSGRFDSTLKIIGNVEARANLPALIVPEIVPGALVYTDAGFYYDAEETSPTPEENSGLLLSSGVGLYVDLFDLAQLVFYTSYLWTEPSVSGTRWVPFGMGFGFHY